MTTNYCSILKEFLEAVKAGNIRERSVGLCSNFTRFCLSQKLSYHERGCAGEILRSMLCNFPKYTGDPVYPLVPQDEYDAHSRAQVDFYDPVTSQGALRQEFVDWTLQEIAQNRVSYMKN